MHNGKFRKHARIEMITTNIAGPRLGGCDTVTLRSYIRDKKNILSYFVLFGIMTNKSTIISQNITLLHVSTLACHPQGACNQYLAKLHKHFNP